MNPAGHMNPAVSDEVWRQLHPDAGRLSHRTAVRTWIVIAAAFVLVVGGLALWQSGAVVPQVSWVVWGVKSTSDTVDMDVEITNGGLAPVTITGIGRSGPGLELVETRGPLPARVASTASVRVTLVFRVTDCGRAPVGSWPVTVRVDRSWGVRTAVPRDFGGDYPWQRAVIDPGCHTRR